MGKDKGGLFKDLLITKIRGKEIKYELTTKTLSGNKIPKIALPKTDEYGEIVRFSYLKIYQGTFPTQLEHSP